MLSTLDAPLSPDRACALARAMGAVVRGLQRKAWDGLRASTALRALVPSSTTALVAALYSASVPAIRATLDTRGLTHSEAVAEEQRVEIDVLRAEIDARRAADAAVASAAAELVSRLQRAQRSAESSERAAAAAIAMLRAAKSEVESERASAVEARAKANVATSLHATIDGRLEQSEAAAALHSAQLDAACAHAARLEAESAAAAEAADALVEQLRNASDAAAVTFEASLSAARGEHAALAQRTVEGRLADAVRIRARRDAHGARLALGQWRDAARGRRDARVKVRRAVQRLAQRSLSAAWVQWCATARFVKQREALTRRALLTLRASHRACTFRTWTLFVERRVERRVLLRAVVARAARAALLLAWSRLRRALCARGAAKAAARNVAANVGALESIAMRFRARCVFAALRIRARTYSASAANRMRLKMRRLELSYRDESSRARKCAVLKVFGCRVRLVHVAAAWRSLRENCNGRRAAARERWSVGCASRMARRRVLLVRDAAFAAWTSETARRLLKKSSALVRRAQDVARSDAHSARRREERLKEELAKFTKTMAQGRRRSRMLQTKVVMSIANDATTTTTRRCFNAWEALHRRAKVASLAASEKRAARSEARVKEQRERVARRVLLSARDARCSSAYLKWGVVTRASARAQAVRENADALEQLEAVHADAQLAGRVAHAEELSELAAKGGATRAEEAQAHAAALAELAEAHRAHDAARAVDHAAALSAQEIEGGTVLSALRASHSADVEDLATTITLHRNTAVELNSKLTSMASAREAASAECEAERAGAAVLASELAAQTTAAADLEHSASLHRSSIIALKSELVLAQAAHEAVSATREAERTYAAAFASELAAQTSAVEELEQSVSSHRSSIVELNSELAMAHSAREGHEAAVAAMEAERADAARIALELVAQKSAAAELEQSVSSHRSSIAALNSELASAREAHAVTSTAREVERADAAALASELAAQTGAAVELERSASSHRSSIVELNNELMLMRSEHKATSATRKAERAGAAALAAELAAQTTAAAELEQSVSSHRSSIVELNSELALAQAAREGHEAAVAAMDAERTDAATVALQLAAQKRAAAELEGYVNSHRGSLVALNSELTSAQAAHATLMAERTDAAMLALELAAHKGTSAELEKSVSSHRSSIVALNSELALAQAAQSAANAERDAERSGAATLVSELAAQTSAAAELERSASSHRHSIVALTSELASAQSARETASVAREAARVVMEAERVDAVAIASELAAQQVAVLELEVSACYAAEDADARRAMTREEIASAEVERARIASAAALEAASEAASEVASKVAAEIESEVASAVAAEQERVRELIASQTRALEWGAQSAAAAVVREAEVHAAALRALEEHAEQQAARRATLHESALLDMQTQAQAESQRLEQLIAAERKTAAGRAEELAAVRAASAEREVLAGVALGEAEKTADMLRVQLRTHRGRCLAILERRYGRRARLRNAWGKLLREVVRRASELREAKRHAGAAQAEAEDLRAQVAAFQPRVRESGAQSEGVASAAVDTAILSATGSVVVGASAVGALADAAASIIFPIGTAVLHTDGRHGTVVAVSANKKKRKVRYDGESKAQRGWTSVKKLDPATGIIFPIGALVQHTDGRRGKVVEVSLSKKKRKIRYDGSSKAQRGWTSVKKLETAVDVVSVFTIGTAVQHTDGRRGTIAEVSGTLRKVKYIGESEAQRGWTSVKVLRKIAPTVAPTVLQLEVDEPYAQSDRGLPAAADADTVDAAATTGADPMPVRRRPRAKPRNMFVLARSRRASDGSDGGLPPPPLTGSSSGSLGELDGDSGCGDGVGDNESGRALVPGSMAAAMLGLDSDDDDDGDLHNVLVKDADGDVDRATPSPALRIPTASDSDAERLPSSPEADSDESATVTTAAQALLDSLLDSKALKSTPTPTPTRATLEQRRFSRAASQQPDSEKRKKRRQRRASVAMEQISPHLDAIDEVIAFNAAALRALFDHSIRGAAMGDVVSFAVLREVAQKVKITPRFVSTRALSLEYKKLMHMHGEDAEAYLVFIQLLACVNGFTPTALLRLPRSVIITLGSP